MIVVLMLVNVFRTTTLLLPLLARSKTLILLTLLEQGDDLRVVAWMPCLHAPDAKIVFIEEPLLGQQQVGLFEGNALPIWLSQAVSDGFQDAFLQARRYWCQWLMFVKAAVTIVNDGFFTLTWSVMG